MANREHIEILKQGANAIDKWRQVNPKSRLNLTNADLFRFNLRRADLSYADMTNATLSEADLRKANLSNAKLSHTIMLKTNLSGAILCQTNLSAAKIVDSDLQGANLMGAYLGRTSFSKSNLAGAIAWGTHWVDLDLSGIVGIELISHAGPSEIGINTLTKSKNIPEIFLRGCGLSDEFISYIPSHFSGSAIDFYSCFISYSHEDKSFASRLYDALQGRGIRCWLDEHQILPGDNIYDRIDHGIRVWDKVLLCASEHSLTSGWVNDELKHAFAKEKKLFKDRGCEVLSLIPLNLDGYLFSDWNHPKKNQVLERMAPDFTGWDSDNTKFEQQLERVVKALQTNNTGREPEPPPKL